MADQSNQWMDHAKLSVGAGLQWALATVFTRFAVLDGSVGLFLAVFASQSIWWVNIHQTTRDTRWSRWLAWSLGASVGAVIGKLMTSYLRMP